MLYIFVLLQDEVQLICEMCISTTSLCTQLRRRSFAWRRLLQSHPRWSPAIPCVTWVFFWTVSWRWMLTSGNSAVPASTNFKGCESFGIVCREGPCWPLRVRLFAIGSTIATTSSVGHLDRLPSVLNTTVRLVVNIPKFSHSSLAICDAHTSRWLSVMSFTGFQSGVALSTKSVRSLCVLVRNCIVGFSAPYTGTLPPCRLRVGSSASSICWPKWPPSSAVSHREPWIARLLNFRTATLEHTASWHSTNSWKL